MSVRSFRRAHNRRVTRERRRLAGAKRRAVVLTATLGASAALAANAQAAGTTYTVTGTGDDAGAACHSDHTCDTLRDALQTATSGSDTITFQPGVSGEIDLTNGALSVPNGVTINGPGAGSLTVSAQANNQVFKISAPAGAQVSISGLTITLGSGVHGAAIENDASTLSLASDFITDSNATTNPASDGGGIWTRGPLSISDSTISGNTATNQGGGIYAELAANSYKPVDVTITNTTIGGTGGSDHNTAAGGGGIAGDANFSITNSEITGNQATINDGRYGGGIYADGGSLTVTLSVVSDNSTTGSQGGGIWAGTTTGTTIKNSTISGNTASSDGGGIELSRYRGDPASNPILIQGTTVAGNQAPEGAGIEVGQNDAQSPITIQASTLSGNQGTGGNSFGGGLRVTYVLSPLEVIDSTISGNTATDGGGVSLGDNRSLRCWARRLDQLRQLDDRRQPRRHQRGRDLSRVTTQPPQTAIWPERHGRAQQHDRRREPGQRSQSGPPPGCDDERRVQDQLQPDPEPGQRAAADPAVADHREGSAARSAGQQRRPDADDAPGRHEPRDRPGQGGLRADHRPARRSADRGPRRSRSRPAATAPTSGRSSSSRWPSLLRRRVSPKSRLSSTRRARITMSHATLNGKVVTNGLAVTWHFQWGKTTSYGKLTPNRAISAGGGTVPVSFQVTGLSPGTVYHYRVVAVSSAGQTATSSDARFKTPAPTINVDPGVVFAGNQVRVFGRAGGCPTGDRVTLISSAFAHAHDFAGKPAIYARVLSGDRYSVVTRIPANRTPARYAVTGRCGGGNFGVTAHLGVLKQHVRGIHVIRFTG